MARKPIEITKQMKDDIGIIPDIDFMVKYGCKETVLAKAYKEALIELRKSAIVLPFQPLYLDKLNSNGYDAMNDALAKDLSYYDRIISDCRHAIEMDVKVDEAIIELKKALIARRPVKRSQNFLWAVANSIKHILKTASKVHGEKNNTFKVRELQHIFGDQIVNKEKMKWLKKL